MDVLPGDDAVAALSRQRRIQVARAGLVVGTLESLHRSRTSTPTACDCRRFRFGAAWCSERLGGGIRREQHCVMLRYRHSLVDELPLRRAAHLIPRTRLDESAHLDAQLLRLLGTEFLRDRPIGED